MVEAGVEITFCKVAEFNVEAGAHRYVNGAVPPVTFTVSVVFCPGHSGFGPVTLADALIELVVETETVAVPVQLFWSVTVTVYVPADNPVAVCVV